MVWIQLFHCDYTYHSFQSLSDYLDHNNNFRELLDLDITGIPAVIPICDGLEAAETVLLAT
jgi:hypothetical protein